jgi:hypothetical protein
MTTAAASMLGQGGASIDSTPLPQKSSNAYVEGGYVEDGYVADAVPPPPADPALEREIFEYALRDDVEIRHSVRTNRVAIVLSVASLVVLINEKLASLRDQRPNDAEAQAARDEEIEHYERLKQDVEALRGAVVRLDDQKPQEKTAENVAITFAQGVQNWWEKDHAKICSTAYNAAVFVSCVSICSLVGSGGPLTVAVSGVLVGGKPVVEALKALPKTMAAIAKSWRRE